jgi:hypothetical protein
MEWDRLAVALIAGLFGVVIGQALRFYSDLLVDLRQAIGDVAEALVYYANIYSNPGIDDFREKYVEATDALRRCSAALRARLYAVPPHAYRLYALLGFVPPREQVRGAAQELIGLSNGMRGMSPLENHNRATAIRRLLRLPEDEG